MRGRLLAVRRTFALAPLVLAAIVPSCNVYPESLLAPRGKAGAAGTGGSSELPQGAGIGWWSGPGDSGCESARQPAPTDRPAAQTAPDVPPMIFALTRLRLGSQDLDGNLSKEAWKDIGLDLDGRCTNTDTCPSAPEDRVSCKSIVVGPDGNYCRDNNFGRYEYDVATLPDLQKFGLNDDLFNCGLTVGIYNILIRVSGYNGTANDDSLRLDIYSSPGLETPSGFDCLEPKEKKLPFLTTSPFLVDEDAMDSPKAGPDLADSKTHSIDAFVRDGYLVAFFPDHTLFRFPNPKDEAKNPIHPFPIVLEKGIVTGKVSKGPEGFYVLKDGLITGRTTKDNVITGFRQVGICEDNPLYKIMTSYVATGLDVLSSGETDETKDCDAMSVAVGIEAMQATAGGLAKLPPLVECEGMGTGGAAGAAGAAGQAGAPAGQAGTGP